MMDRNVGLANTMLRLKEKVEGMIREPVALRREREELQGNKRLLAQAGQGRGGSCSG